MTAAEKNLLQRLDPRLKLLLLVLLVVATFSAREITRLVWLFLPAAALLLWRPPLLGLYRRRLYRLRWLLLFTLLLHLFLTPGRTLWGTRLLSLDGLLRGGLVDLQLMLAFCFALGLTSLTRPEALAWGLSRCLQPLRRFGLPLDENGGLLVLALHFVPVVFTQGTPLLDQMRGQDSRGLAARLEQLAATIGELLLALVDQAEQLAQRIQRGESPWQEARADCVWRATDSWVLVVGLVFFGLFWGL